MQKTLSIIIAAIAGRRAYLFDPSARSKMPGRKREIGRDDG